MFTGVDELVYGLGGGMGEWKGQMLDSEGQFDVDIDIGFVVYFSFGDSVLLVVSIFAGNVIVEAIQRILLELVGPQLCIKATREQIVRRPLRYRIKSIVQRVHLVFVLDEVVLLVLGEGPEQLLGWNDIRCAEGSQRNKRSQSHIAKPYIDEYIMEYCICTIC